MIIEKEKKMQIVEAFSVDTITARCEGTDFLLTCTLALLSTLGKTTLVYEV